MTNDSADAAIEVRGLTKRFGSVQAVDGADFQVGTGGLFGFLGPNGAGKTTTINMLTGLARPDACTAPSTAATGCPLAWIWPSSASFVPPCSWPAWPTSGGVGSPEKYLVPSRVLPWYARADNHTLQPASGRRKQTEKRADSGNGEDLAADCNCRREVLSLLFR